MYLSYFRRLEDRFRLEVETTKDKRSAWKITCIARRAEEATRKMEADTRTIEDIVVRKDDEDDYMERWDRRKGRNRETGAGP